MARIKGGTPYSGSFESQQSAPLDSRSTTEFVADLYLDKTWEALDGESYAYPGMTVSVWNDTVENNGTYMLTALPTSEVSNWVKSGGASSASPVHILPEALFTLNDGATEEEITTAFVTLDAVTDMINEASEYTVFGRQIVNVDDVTSVVNMQQVVIATDAMGAPEADSPRISVVYTLADFTTEGVLDPTTNKEITITLMQDDTTWVYSKNERPTASIGEDTYTNTEGTSITVGGIPAGTIFNGMPLAEAFDLLVNPELIPTWTDPSLTFITNLGENGCVEAGTEVTITFTTTFDQGTIELNGTDVGDRAGLPTQYNYSGDSISPSSSSSTLTDSQTIVMTMPSSPTSIAWMASVDYAEGDQPVTSKGNNHGTPLEAGNTGMYSTSLEVVHAYYATTADIATVTKQPLIDGYGTYYEVDMTGESDIAKQTIQYAVTVDNELTGVEFYNTNSGKWEWLSGSESNSLGNFDYTEITRTEPAGDVQYRQYVNNTAKTGARSLRFHVK